jgi:hypothetical protein
MKSRARYEASERALLAAFSPEASQSSTTLPSVYVLPTDASRTAGNMASPSSSFSGSGAPAAAAEPPRPLDANVMLQLLFQYYCRFGRTSGMTDEEDFLDSFNFAKFTRDCPGLLDKTLNPTEIDLIFVKCRTKGSRRLAYGQWLDALSAMSTVKYPEIDDPAASFSFFLTTHVLSNPAAIGIAQAARSGLISVEVAPITAASGMARPRSRSPSTDRTGSAAPGLDGASTIRSPRASAAGVDAGRFSAAAAAVGLSPAAVRGHRLAPEVGSGPAPTLASAPSPRGGASASSLASLPAELAQIPGMAEAVRAAAEALQRAAGGGSPSGAAAPSSPFGSPGGPGFGVGLSSSSGPRSVGGGDNGSVKSTSGSSIGPAGVSLAGNYSAPPADVYELIARKALEIQVQQLQASGVVEESRSGSGAGATSPSQERPQMDAALAAAIAAATGGTTRSESPRGPRPWSPTQVRGPTGAAAAGIRAPTHSTVRIVAAQGASLETIGA